jgi:hypothetical protein
MDNCRAASKDQDGQLEGLCPTDKLVIGEWQSYSSSSSSSSVQSAMTTASKREWEDNNNVNDNDDNDSGLNDNNGLSKYELKRMGNIARNNARLAFLGLLVPMTSATTLSSPIERNAWLLKIMWKGGFNQNAMRNN